MSWEWRPGIRPFHLPAIPVHRRHELLELLLPPCEFFWVIGSGFLFPPVEQTHGRLIGHGCRRRRGRSRKCILDDLCGVLGRVNAAAPGLGSEPPLDLRREYDRHASTSSLPATDIVTPWTRPFTRRRRPPPAA